MPIGELKFSTDFVGVNSLDEFTELDLIFWQVGGGGYEFVDKLGRRAIHLWRNDGAQRCELNARDQFDSGRPAAKELVGQTYTFEIDYLQPRWPPDGEGWFEFLVASGNRPIPPPPERWFSLDSLWRNGAGYITIRGGNGNGNHNEVAAAPYALPENEWFTMRVSVDRAWDSDPLNPEGRFKLAIDGTPVFDLTNVLIGTLPGYVIEFAKCYGPTQSNEVYVGGIRLWEGFDDDDPPPNGGNGTMVDGPADQLDDLQVLLNELAVLVLAMPDSVSVDVPTGKQALLDKLKEILGDNLQAD